MSASNILISMDADGIALITINRPDKLNALNRAVIGELDQALDRVPGQGARGLIVTGAGDKSFVAGADIGELCGIEPAGAHDISTRTQAVFRKLETLPFPSVAAIQGYALGGGLELAMACTIRVAGPDARLGQPEVKLGLVPGYGGTQRLPRLVGRGRALAMLLGGEAIGAAKAYRIGLVDYVTPANELLTFSRQWLKKVALNGPLAVELTMKAVDAGLDAGMDVGLRYEALAFSRAAASQDCREGTRAFLEKRRPSFSGK